MSAFPCLQVSFLASTLSKLLAHREAAVSRLEAALVALGRTRNVAAAKAAKGPAQAALEEADARLKEAMKEREKKLAGNEDAKNLVSRALIFLNDSTR